MASHREIVWLPGRLNGMGRDERCNVLAEEVSLPGTDISEYSRPIIFDAALDMPQGCYALQFGGKTVSVERLGGAWVAPV